jgi:hypothetical protein
MRTSDNDILRYNLSSNEKYIKRNPIIIRFSLKNVSKSDLWVLKWYTPLEGIKGKIFRVICDGKEILYEGRMIKRGTPSKHDYVHIESNKSVSSQVDLSEAYVLPECSECLVKFNGKIGDISTSADFPKKNGEFTSLTIYGNTITFKIVN